jgi:hypothetical protein
MNKRADGRESGGTRQQTGYVFKRVGLIRRHLASSASSAHVGPCKGLTDLPPLNNDKIAKEKKTSMQGHRPADLPPAVD